MNVAIGPQGPIIDVAVGVGAARRQALQSAGQPIPGDVQCRLLIDTGASNTNICTSVIQQLALTPTGIVKVLTPSTGSTPVDMAQFDIRLVYTFAGLTVTIDPLPATCADFTAQGFHGLLGRDQLARALLVYHGDVNLCSFAL